MIGSFEEYYRVNFETTQVADIPAGQERGYFVRDGANYRNAHCQQKWEAWQKEFPKESFVGT